MAETVEPMNITEELKELVKHVTEGSRKSSPTGPATVTLGPYDAKRIADYLYMLGYRRTQ